MEDLNHLQKNLNPSRVIPPLLLVEDDQSLRSILAKIIAKKLQVTCYEACTPAEALSIAQNFNQKFCLVTDISFNENSYDGLVLIDLLKERSLEFESIVMTGFGSIESAIQSTKKGAFHYLTKPFEALDLVGLISKLYQNCFRVNIDSPSAMTKEFNKLNNQNSREVVIEEPTNDDFFCGMIGRSPAMREVFEKIIKVAACDSTVLITGPSGTGKELVSDAIHRLSLRSQNARVSINCGAIPGELLESELFGYQKGAFTGAMTDRKGRFELAHKGSIFLDEIGDMPFLLQVKLLRALQNREIERVGGSHPIPIDVRIIAATHQNLEQAVSKGDFREDLYYRLSVIPVNIPPLCKRKEDIPLLISYFCKKFASADGRNMIDFHHDTLELFLDYSWPGNVRELENLIERLIILKGGSIIQPSDLPEKFLINFNKTAKTQTEFIELTDEGINLKKLLSEIESSLILQALKLTGGNKNQASKLLSLNRTTLIEKLKKKGLSQDIIR